MFVSSLAFIFRGIQVNSFAYLVPLLQEAETAHAWQNIIYMCVCVYIDNC